MDGEAGDRRPKLEMQGLGRSIGQAASSVARGAACLVSCSLCLRQIDPATNTTTTPSTAQTISPPSPPFAKCGAAPNNANNESSWTPTGPAQSACNFA